MLTIAEIRKFSRYEVASILRINTFLNGIHNSIQYYTIVDSPAMYTGKYN